MIDAPIVLDAWMSAWLTPPARVTAWALLSAAVSMGLYARLSPQPRLHQLKTEQKKARAALMAHDGDFSQMMMLIRTDLALSLRHIRLMLPAVVFSILPVAWVLLALPARYETSDMFIDFEWLYMGILLAASLLIKYRFRIA